MAIGGPRQDGQREAHMSTPVKLADFEIRENEVIHKPTGARLSAHPGLEEPAWVSWGRAGEVLDTGAEYDRDDVFRVAKELLANRKR